METHISMAWFGSAKGPVDEARRNYGQVRTGFYVPRLKQTFLLPLNRFVLRTSECKTRCIITWSDSHCVGQRNENRNKTISYITEG